MPSAAARSQIASQPEHVAGVAARPAARRPERLVLVEQASPRLVVHERRGDVRVQLGERAHEPGLVGVPVRPLRSAPPRRWRGGVRRQPARSQQPGRRGARRARVEPAARHRPDLPGAPQPRAHRAIDDVAQLALMRGRRAEVGMSCGSAVHHVQRRTPRASIHSAVAGATKRTPSTNVRAAVDTQREHLRGPLDVEGVPDAFQAGERQRVRRERDHSGALVDDERPRADVVASHEDAAAPAVDDGERELADDPVRHGRRPSVRSRPGRTRCRAPTGRPPGRARPRARRGCRGAGRPRGRATRRGCAPAGDRPRPPAWRVATRLPPRPPCARRSPPRLHRRPGRATPAHPACP